VNDPAFPIPTKSPDQQGPPGRTPVEIKGPDAQGWYEVVSNPEHFAYPLPETGTTLSGAMGIAERLRIRAGDNSSCEWRGERDGGFKREDWNCSVYSAFRLTSTAEFFEIEETVRAREGDAVVFERIHRGRVKRDLV
jgi:hypothetical protein